MVCSKCYRRMQEQPIEVSCFGKISMFQLVDGKPVQLVRGYHPQAPECQDYCPDRRTCRAVLLGESL